MPNPAKLDPPTEFRAHIPTTLYREVSMRLWDPVLQKQKYGAASELLTRLLSEWVKTAPVNPIAAEHFAQEDQDAASRL